MLSSVKAQLLEAEESFAAGGGAGIGIGAGAGAGAGTGTGTQLQKKFVLNGGQHFIFCWQVRFLADLVNAKVVGISHLFYSKSVFVHVHHHCHHH